MTNTDELVYRYSNKIYIIFNAEEFTPCSNTSCTFHIKDNKSVQIWHQYNQEDHMIQLPHWIRVTDHIHQPNDYNTLLSTSSLKLLSAPVTFTIHDVLVINWFWIVHHSYSKPDILPACQRTNRIFNSCRSSFDWCGLYKRIDWNTMVGCGVSIQLWWLRILSANTEIQH